MNEKAPALTHLTIGELEQGGIGYAIDKSLEEALADCARRPGLEQWRTVTITVKVKPKANTLDEGQPGLKNVGVQASVKLATPARAGDEEFLNVATEANPTTGEVVTQATFAQVPLLRAGSN